MRIAVVSFWYNEAVLAPFFLKHYSYADLIYLVIDTASTDGCRDLAAWWPRVEIEDSTFPDGKLDDVLKIRRYNEIFKSLDCDWGFAVDADEFIFGRNFEPARYVLARQVGNLMYAEMWNVYKHISEGALNPLLPPVMQRRHGDPIVSPPYRKPIIVKPEIGIEWSPGNHVYKSNPNIVLCAESFQGVHWQNADAETAVERRIRGRRDRLSKANIAGNFGVETRSLTEEGIRAECKAHLYDPQLF